ncbi:uncharacterized protein LOC108935603 [Scleropages formosus]|uniref:uncharacterized protein LOC108935603 n=1 Tax=Scleropages formosus TaxID=113540 RepID=UPI00087893F2|nr:uncharacterized protein LOC108935603 [Scleropages formosus]
MIFSASTEDPVVRISVPEGHYIIIPCSSPQWRKSDHMIWRFGDNQVIGKRSWDIVFDINRRKYDLLPDGSLLVKVLRPENSGEYYCNDYKAADLEVLTGQDYSVSAGGTILLPCKISDRLKQKWMFKKNRQSRRRVILLKYKNGTVTKEIDDPQNRFTTTDFELRILNLQPADGGEYFCNGLKTATVSVTTEAPDNTEELTTDETDRAPSQIV